MTLTRWVGWVREVVRALRGLPDEDIRRQTLAIHEQLVRLRKHRAAQEEIREAMALKDIRRIVEEMQALERNLVEAERATVEYVDSIAEQAKSQMEADLDVEAGRLMKTVMQSQNLGLHDSATPTSAPGQESKLSQASSESASAGSVTQPGRADGPSGP